MLGRLATWLRILGLDTVFAAQMSLADFQDWRQRGRVGLTRRTALRGSPGVIFIESDHYPEQLAQACRELGFKPRPEDLFTRCLRCNEPLRDVDRQAVLGRVPEYVFQTQEKFRRCPACDRLYWSGTHPERMWRFLESIGLERA